MANAAPSDDYLGGLFASFTWPVIAVCILLTLLLLIAVDAMNIFSGSDKFMVDGRVRCFLTEMNNL